MIVSKVWTDVMVGYRMSSNIRERGTSYCLIISPYRLYNFLNDDCKRSFAYLCTRSFLESRVSLRIKHLDLYEEKAKAQCISCEIKTPYAGEDGILLIRNKSLWLGNRYRHILIIGSAHVKLTRLKTSLKIGIGNPLHHTHTVVMIKVSPNLYAILLFP